MFMSQLMATIYCVDQNMQQYYWTAVRIP